MNGIRIIGTGSYVPPRVLTNFDLQEMGLDTSDEWITRRTGIRERRIADPGISTSDLACEASTRALEIAGITTNDLDLIIMATITPDTCCPSGANWLQAKLKAKRAVTFDVSARDGSIHKKDLVCLPVFGGGLTWGSALIRWC